MLSFTHARDLVTVLTPVRPRTGFPSPTDPLPFPRGDHSRAVPWKAPSSHAPKDPSFLLFPLLLPPVAAPPDQQFSVATPARSSAALPAQVRLGFAGRPAPPPQKVAGSTPGKSSSVTKVLWAGFPGVYPLASALATRLSVCQSLCVRVAMSSGLGPGAKSKFVHLPNRCSLMKPHRQMCLPSLTLPPKPFRPGEGAVA